MLEDESAARTPGGSHTNISGHTAIPQAQDAAIPEAALGRFKSAMLAGMPKAVERSELVEAAEAIETDVSRLEAFADNAKRTKLNGEKAIARAARELAEAMKQQEKLGESLRELTEVIGRTQERQHAALARLSAHATEIQQRMTRLTGYMERFGGLGAQAAEAAQLLQALPVAELGGNHTAELLEVDQRFTVLVADAKALADAALADEFGEIAREADALKQRIQALRGRVAELLRARAAGTS